MTGITPAVFTFKGIFEVWPPTIFLPCTLLAYCTGIFRVPSFKIITSTTIAMMIAIMIAAARIAVAGALPNTNCSNRVFKSSGSLEIMLITRTIEIPFPIPFSVILSPTHIRNALPAVSVAMEQMTLIALN